MKRECVEKSSFTIRILAVLAFLLFAATAKASDSDGGMRIEQARICMPDVRVYYYPGNSSTGDITATLSDEKLSLIGSHPYSEDTNGTDYYILVDISLSISREYFASVREALIGFPEKMRENDTLTVITFGDQVTVVLDKAKQTDDIKGALEGLENSDMNTHLFEAFDRTVELADKEELIGRRCVALVISDGEDCSTNEKTKSEALENLQKAGIPMYAMAVRETAHGEANAFIEDFSDFVRATQGRLYVFGQDEAQSCLQGIQDMLDTAQVLELAASSNRITSVMQPLTLVVSGEGSESLQVCPRYNKKDKEAPSAAIEQPSEKTLKILYSEPVVGADSGSSYKVSCDGESLPVYVVSYSEEEGPAALLSFEEPLPAGKYTVEFQNITDHSMEENPLSGSVSLQIEEETESEQEEKEEEKKSWNIPVVPLAAAAGVLILLIVIVLVIRSRKKKGQEQESSPLDQSRLKFTVRSDEGERTIEAAISDRLVVGRSSSCDVSIVDKLLSRHHFAIEKDSGFFYITDLGTTNGTMVNGIKIVTRCKLKNGDVVQAGSLYITITW